MITVTIHQHCVHDHHYNTSTLFSRSPLQYINTVFTITITIHPYCVHHHHYNTSTLCSRSPLQYINTVLTITITIHQHCVHDHHYNTSTLNLPSVTSPHPTHLIVAVLRDLKASPTVEPSV
ncbi:hypothetical protein RRG08_031279 [Elysia crispata]|uniref:Uncharacterized protein n=1 Tax=Elysia crispata TaxID=231223 RepID=A0AAE1E0R5_9GAST|nr:hypothetical protein RRG08_031279 [Elysia crispata]